jgi:hypothetical protein
MVWPDFLVIGTPKGGTTALHSALVRYPRLFLSPVKEPKSEQRRDVLSIFADDIGLLEQVTGRSFADWRADTGRGEFSQRRPG